ncbi:hypothetical protein, partial [Bacteroides ovatus]|uniref:hypothetical protein n=1 Tax=Bacteroides ovatus TaxID=28116 RepID=UPI001E4EE6A1
TDVRVRIREIVVRIRHRDTAIRVRVVVATINHTAYGEAPPFNLNAKVRFFINYYLTNSYKTPETKIFQRADARKERRSPCSGNTGRFVASLPL